MKTIYKIFIEILEKKLDQEQLFEFFDYIERAKANVAEMYKSPSALLAATRHIVSEPGFLIRFLRVRLFGESIPHRLADEWIRKGNTCCGHGSVPQPERKKLADKPGRKP